MPPSRRYTILGGILLAPVLLIGGAVLFTSGNAGGPPQPVTPLEIDVSEQANATALARSITALQDRLRDLPKDFSSWSALGYAYVAQARATADPSYYPRAEEAFALVIAERPDDADAIAGMGALANARHEFATGRDLATQAVAADPYDSTAKGVLADAQLQLGEYDAALVTLQEMVDLRPGVASFTRISDSYELRGDLEGARYALERSLEVSAAPSDASFVLFYLGELAFNSGDYELAAQHYAEGLRRDPGNVTILAGQAKVAAALGDVEAAVAGWAEVVQRLPQPVYLVAYGELLQSLGRTEEAQEQYDVADAASKLFTASGVTPDVEVAIYAADHGRPAEALEIAEAQYATRRSVEVEDALAWALHANGRYEEALEHALEAQRLGTRNAVFDYHRGMIQMELGLVDEARASLTLALETSPAFSPLRAPIAEAALNSLDAPP